MEQKSSLWPCQASQGVHAPVHKLPSCLVLLCCQLTGRHAQTHGRALIQLLLLIFRRTAFAFAAVSTGAAIDLQAADLRPLHACELPISTAEASAFAGMCRAALARS